MVEVVNFMVCVFKKESFRVAGIKSYIVIQPKVISVMGSPDYQSLLQAVLVGC